MAADNAQQLLQLHDIHLPAGPGWWPPAPGWWVVGIVLLLLLLWSGIKLFNWYRIKRWRHKLLKEFSQFHNKIDQMDDSEFVTEISSHLRQLSLILFPANDVASLTGNSWLTFLDEQSHQQVFFQEPGKFLIELPYQKSDNALSTEQKKQLLNLAQQWAVYNVDRFLSLNKKLWRPQ